MKHTNKIRRPDCVLCLALSLAALVSTPASACFSYAPYDIAAVTERSDTVVKARIVSANPGEVIPKNEWIKDEAYILTLETLYTFKGRRDESWQVAVRYLPTFGVPDLGYWRKLVGETRVIMLDPPFHPPRPVGPVLSWSTVGGDPETVWGSVPDGEGGGLYEIVGLPCSERMIFNKDWAWELRIAAIAQRDLLIFIFAMILAYFIGRGALLRTSER